MAGAGEKEIGTIAVKEKTIVPDRITGERILLMFLDKRTRIVLENMQFAEEVILTIQWN